MLPRERVLAALQHREGDRVPWGEHWIDYNVYEDVLGRPSLVHGKIRETRALWDGGRDEVVAGYKRDVLDLVRALELDIVTVEVVPPAGYRPKPMEPVGDDTYRDEHGHLFRVSATTHNLMPYRTNEAAYVAPTVASVQAEIDRLADEPAPDPRDSRWELVRHAVRAMKATHFIMVLCGDVAFPGFGPDDAAFWKSLLREPEVCRKLAELAGRRLVREVPVYAALGVDAIMPCGDLGSSTGLLASPRIFRELVLPWNRAHAAEARRHGLWILKHCCGHVWPVIDDLADTYDAYESIQASAGMDIAALKQRVGARLCLWGGIRHENLLAGAPADIRADAAYALRTAAPGGGFILGSTHSLAVGAKIENVLEMKRCRDEWGSYPIDPGRM